jgi:hypothetical protein
MNFPKTAGGALRAKVFLVSLLLLFVTLGPDRVLWAFASASIGTYISLSVLPLLLLRLGVRPRWVTWIRREESIPYR